MSENFSFKKISLFIPNLYGGGAERVFISLANIFSKAGFEVELITGIKEGQLASQVDNLTVIDLKARSIARSIIPLTKHLRKNPPDILLSALPHANLAAIIAATASRKKMKVVCSVHENVFYSFSRISAYEKMILQMLKAVYRLSHGIVAVSQGLLDSQISFYKKTLPRHQQKIFNPIVENLSTVVPFRKPGGTKENFRIISAGRLSVEKDFITLIRSFSLLTNRENVTLTIFGEGPERQKLEELVEELGLGQHVFLPGFSNDIRSQFIASDLFIMSSIWEGFGNVLVEAMAAGCPIISTNCESGPPEILAGGKFGKLVPVGDFEAMARAIERFRKGDVLLFNTEAAVARFTFDVIGAEYLQFFQKCFDNDQDLAKQHTLTTSY